MDDETHAGAQHFCSLIEQVRGDSSPPRVLAAGCGLGHEARYIRERLGGETIGIDQVLPTGELEAAGGGPALMEASVLDLPFESAHFDAVFYHHVIEHVGDARASLAELARVLRSGGWLYVGTPNRHRAVGYVGSFDASVREKLVWNLTDYRARLRGRFRNELGAHAGFSQSELRRMLETDYRDYRSLTSDYLRFKYGGRIPRALLWAVADSPLREVAAPGVYAICRRG